MAAASLSSENSTKKIYATVIDEVLNNVREAFVDDGCDEQALENFKKMWESKLIAASSNMGGSDPLGLLFHHGGASASNSLGVQSRPPSIQQLPRSHPGSAFHSPAMGHHGAASFGDGSEAPGDFKPPSAYNGGKSLARGNQLDGVSELGSSDEEDELPAGDEDEDDLRDDNATSDEHGGEYQGREDSDPLNSDDDLTGPDSNTSNAELFDTDQLIVCQYDKITRIKNRWKFHLKDGIMNINGKDYLFSKATGDAEW